MTSISIQRMTLLDLRSKHSLSHSRSRVYIFQYTHSYIVHIRILICAIDHHHFNRSSLFFSTISFAWNGCVCVCALVDFSLLKNNLNWKNKSFHITLKSNRNPLDRILLRSRPLENWDSSFRLALLGGKMFMDAAGKEYKHYLVLVRRLVLKMHCCSREYICRYVRLSVLSVWRCSSQSFSLNDQYRCPVSIIHLEILSFRSAGASCKTGRKNVCLYSIYFTWHNPQTCNNKKEINAN